MGECLELSELLVSFLKTVNIELRVGDLFLKDSNESFVFDKVETEEDGMTYCKYHCSCATITFYGMNGYLTGAKLELNGLVYDVFDEVWDVYCNIRRSLYINHANDVGVRENGIVVEPICSQLFSSTGIGDYSKGPQELLYIGCSTSGIELSIDDIDSKHWELNFHNYKRNLSKAIKMAYAEDDKLREAFLRSSSVISDTYGMMTRVPVLCEDVLRGSIETHEEMLNKEFRTSRSLVSAMALNEIDDRRKLLEMHIKKYGIDGGEKNSPEELNSKRICYTINM